MRFRGRKQMSDPQDEMEQEDFATLFAREGAKRALQVGQVVKGRILQIGEETLFVDVGGKGEALIERAELTDADGNLTVKVGDEIEATVVRSGDDIRLSYRLLQGIQAREGLAVAAQTGLPVEGKVAAVIKGGYEVTVAGLRAFCPFSQMDLRRTDAPGGVRRARAGVPHRALFGAGPEHRAHPAGHPRRAGRGGRGGNAQEAPARRRAPRHRRLARRVRRLRGSGRGAGPDPGLRDLALARGPARRPAARRRDRHGEGAQDRRGQGPDLAQPEGARDRSLDGDRRPAARSPDRPRPRGPHDGLRRLRRAACRASTACCT